MKKLLIAAICASAFCATQAMAETVTAQATATWDATATKDTSSALVVTPTDSLNFQYSENATAFNSQNGAFDITVEGQSGATDFELTAQLISNTLTSSSNDSTLAVGVEWNGEKLSKDNTTTLINISEGVTSGLESLTNDEAYASNKRVSGQGNFAFSIDSATSASTDANGDESSSTSSDFASLEDGYWSGDVKVQFTATWTTPDSATEA